MSETARSAAAGASGAEKMSEWSRLMGVFFSPVTTFQDIARKPTWVLPLVVVIAAFVVSTALVMPHFDWDRTIREGIEQSGQHVDEEQVGKIVPYYERVGPVIGYGGALLWAPVVSLVAALMYFAPSFSS